MSLIKKTFFVGLNTGLIENGQPDERCRDFYSRRSGHGLYCSIIGNVVIPGGHGTNSVTPQIKKSPAWPMLARSIAEAGAVPGIQLTTTWNKFSGMKNFLSRDSSIDIKCYKSAAESFSDMDVEQLFIALREGTNLAIEAGFKHIQIHAAHGYVFNVLADTRLFTNGLAVLQKIKAWAEYVSSCGVETSIRFSLRSGDDAFDADRKAFHKDIVQLPFDFHDVSSGFYNINKRLIYPSLKNIIDARYEETVELAYEYPKTQFIFSGRSMRRNPASLPANLHLGVCRDLIANPDYLNDSRWGCVNCGKCHYYSRGAVHVTCPQWKFI